MLTKEINIPTDVLDLVNAFIDHLKLKPEIVGIVLLGGLGKKQHFDKYSDIDVAIFTEIKVSEKNPSWLPSFEFFVHFKSAMPSMKRINFNVHQQNLIKELNSNWDEVKKEAYTNGIIVFDRSGKLNQLIQSKITCVPEVIKENVIRIMAKLPPYTLINPIKQAKRGLFLQAHSLLNQGIGFIVEMLYIINNQFLPHDKWRIERSFSLEWLPGNYKGILNKAMLVKAHTLKDVERRVQLVKKLVDPVANKASQNFLPSDFDFYDYACKHLLGRQLILEPFASIAIQRFHAYFSAKQLEHINGFVNYHLIQSWSELRSLLETKKSFTILGEKECQKILQLLASKN